MVSEESTIIKDSGHHTFGAKEGVFRFGSVTRRRGGYFIGIAAMLATATLFLASQIPATPDLKVDMALLSMIGATGAATLALHGIGLVFGRIRVDAQGVQVYCGLERYSFRWSDLATWNSMESTPNAAFPAMRFTLHRPPRTREIPGGYLPHQDLGALITIIRQHTQGTTLTAPNHRRTTLHSNGVATMRS